MRPRLQSERAEPRSSRSKAGRRGGAGCCRKMQNAWRVCSRPSAIPPRNATAVSPVHVTCACHPCSVTHAVSPVHVNRAVSPVHVTRACHPCSVTHAVSPVHINRAVSPVHVTRAVSPVQCHPCSVTCSCQPCSVTCACHPGSATVQVPFAALTCRTCPLTSWLDFLWVVPLAPKPVFTNVPRGRGLMGTSTLVVEGPRRPGREDRYVWLSQWEVD
jgi:hypothetical protein